MELFARRWERPVESARAKKAGYSASWSSIVSMLRAELRALNAKRPVIEMDVTERDIRNDGWLYSSARPHTPGVRLTFQSKHGDLAYECGTWTNWEHNIYAIARTLRAQRMIARDGAVKGDQVYKGFRQLPSGGGTGNGVAIQAGEWATVEDAMRFMSRVGEGPIVSALPSDLVAVYRQAARKSHPDLHGGDGSAMAKVNRARDFIEQHTKHGAST